MFSAEKKEQQNEIPDFVSFDWLMAKASMKNNNQTEPWEKKAFVVEGNLSQRKAFLIDFFPYLTINLPL